MQRWRVSSAAGRKEAGDGHRARRRHRGCRCGAGRQARDQRLGGTEAVTQGQNSGERRIVAGVDGSGPSKAALAWAARQALLTGAVVDAVIAWEFPASSDMVTVVNFDYEGIAAKVLADTIAQVASPATIRPKLVQGHAAKVLIDISDGAELLVVGSRGHGGFAGLLLGSVSQHCIHHAHCPVVVIRGPDRGPA